MNTLKGLALYLALVLSVAGLAAQFAEVTNTGLPGVNGRSAAWGDYDNDGDLDVLIVGESPNNVGVTKLCRNNGDNTFTVINTGLANLQDGDGSWGDYDNDGDLDILLVGTPSTGMIAKVYRNDMNDTFTDIGAALVPMADSNSAWADIDNDGDLDIIHTGYIITPGPYYFVTKIYRNIGSNTFSEIMLGLPGEGNAGLRTGDLDQDGDLDFNITGGSVFGNKLFINNGDSTFSITQLDLGGTIALRCDLGDYDNDGDLDLVIGSDQNQEMRLFRNDGGFSFVNTGLSIWVGSCTTISWGDYDNDGDLDILFTGQHTFDIYPVSLTRIFSNDGNNTFIETTTNVLPLQGKAAWGDYDNDGDLDFLLTGYTMTGGYNNTITPTTKLYLNYSSTPNAVPLAPTNLHVSSDDTTTEFIWDAQIDDHTPSLGLNYELRIGNTPTDVQISSPMANDTGYRLIPARGYVGSNCSWKIKRSALPDLFYWSVQAIDTAFQGSAFAPIQEVSFLPRVSLLSAPTISYGSVPVEGTSDWVVITFKNISLAELDINSVHFYSTPSQFELNYPHAGLPLSAGTTDTLYVRFSPMSVGAISDTLYIVSDAVNIPVLKIRLSGTGIHVPPQAPESPLISMDGNNVVLTWDAVTQTIFNTPVTPDYYLVFHASDPYGEYTYLGATNSHQYTHPLAGLFSPFMFYKVIAYKYYGRGGFDPASLGLEQGMPEDEVLLRLTDAN